MTFIVKIALGLLLGTILGQKELEQLYREYKDSKKEVDDKWKCAFSM